jgi:hypothetical protein
MSSRSSWRMRLAEQSIWVFAFGYFACYVPYSFMTKLLSKGLIAGLDGRSLAGFSLLPLSVLASAIGMLVFITAMGWWKYASHTRLGGIDVPHPTRWTFLSGLCTALIIGTTTLAYTFEGISIVFAMLLMRGGVLIIAPVVDALTKRSVRWFSWAALACALAALLLGVTDTNSYALSLVAALDIAVYLAAYFVRLRFMSRLAKSEARASNRRFFVEEQITAAPMLVLVLGAWALFGGSGQVAVDLREGFTAYWDQSFFWAIVLVGLLSQGTGIFGSLIFLDKRENTFCVPVNRSSSVLAGVLASFWVAAYPGQSMPAWTQLAGAGIIILAILFLTIPPMAEKRRLRLAAQAIPGA